MIKILDRSLICAGAAQTFRSSQRATGYGPENVSLHRHAIASDAGSSGGPLPRATLRAPAMAASDARRSHSSSFCENRLLRQL